MKICFKENFGANIFEEEQTKLTLKLSRALNNKRLDRSKNSSINTIRNIQNNSNKNDNNNSSIKNTANEESITNLVINNIEKINDNDSIIRLDGNSFAVDLYVSSTSFDKEFEDENEEDYSKSKILKLNLNKNKILNQNPKHIKKYFSVNLKKNEKDEPEIKNVLKSSVSFM
jgi:hypothetical protein